MIIVVFPVRCCQTAICSNIFNLPLRRDQHLVFSIRSASVQPGKYCIIYIFQTKRPRGRRSLIEMVDRIKACFSAVYIVKRGFRGEILFLPDGTRPGYQQFWCSGSAGCGLVCGFSRGCIANLIPDTTKPAHRIRWSCWHQRSKKRSRAISWRRLIFFGEESLRKALSENISHYHKERNHPSVSH